ncbi:MAG: patatin-like phospholipase family protein [Acidobacteria bacterium]|nr:patatin-like phospholipase family protein [Acidobacteriota bacterium]
MTTRLHLHAYVLAGACVLLSGSQPAAQRTCPACFITRFWEVPTDEWTGKIAEPFLAPEMAPRYAGKLRTTDFGVAFSGGGTRSATATMGQLRGLRRNGWLSRVKYMTAVSGGAWAAIPYTYLDADQPVDGFLDLYQDPSSLDKVALDYVTPRSLAASIGNSGLFSSGLKEAFNIGRQKLLSDQFNKYVDLARKGLAATSGTPLADPARIDKTYAHMIGSVFVAPHVSHGTTDNFAWDDETVTEFNARNPPLAGVHFVTVAKDRPFLIVEGTLIHQHDAYEFPRLAPVEITPLYMGVRQQYTGKVGGTYVWPWAYDSATVRDERPPFVSVTTDPVTRAMTLADVAGTVGAAPELGTIVLKQINALTDFFPKFNHFAVREGHATAMSRLVSHGDGGGVDNLGLMPLLARRVHNIMVFINTDTSDFRRNDDLESLFREIDIFSGGGDRAMIHVFDKDRYEEVKSHFAASAAKGDALVYCGTNWTVHENELFNVRGYTGLNICFFYNAMSANWMSQLPAETRRLLEHRDKDAKEFDDFPWYRTFGQDKFRLIKLDARQVNMLSNLTAWTVANPVSVTEVLRAMGDTLPAPQHP